MTGTIQISATISGKVQGVFFRQECQGMARKLNVTGWVKNLPSGDVKAVFEGDPAMVHKMEAWCHQGSVLARPSSVVTEKSLPVSGFETFEIRY